MTRQTYEEYWKLTNAYTNYNGNNFKNVLTICVNFIDLYKEEEYSGEKYSRLQLEIQSHTGINLVSIRKAINQLVKMGFVNSFLKSYHPLAPEYINARSNKKRTRLLSRIVYSNSSFNRAINVESEERQINFLIQTLIEKGTLTKEEIKALMLVDISSVKEGFLDEASLKEYVDEARDIDFLSRKYNQVAYLRNLLNKLEDLTFVGDTLYFTEDAEQIFGKDLRGKTRKRDPYLHRLYKNQLKEESTELLGGVKCMLEKLNYPVLVASHIKPFIQSDENEAYDPNNGLLLSRTVDSLFDLLYISFSDEGVMLFSKRVHEDVKGFWKDYRLDGDLLNDDRKKYLAYHRNLLANKDAAFAN